MSKLIANMFRTKKTPVAGTRAFTLIELLISISIFAFMTAFLVAKYGTFNQGILLTNLAYDTALTVRSAQAYGLNVQGQATSTAVAGFTYSYGVHFAKASKQFIFFVDLCGSGKYESGSVCSNNALLSLSGTGETINTYTMRPEFSISSICAGTLATCNPVTTSLDVLFKRPNPDAIIVADGNTSPSSQLVYAQIRLNATDGSTKSVIVQSTGQIAVAN